MGFFDASDDVSVMIYIKKKKILATFSLVR